MVKAHDFPEVYKALDLNLSKLGCIMLDTEPIKIDHWMSPMNGGATSYLQDLPLYKSPNPEHFWIDGYVADKTPHLTLLYGLLKSGTEYKEHVDRVLSGWNLSEVVIDHFGTFDSPYPDEPYHCVVAHIKVTPELMEGHERLGFLPHLNTFAGYKPHITIAYIDSSEGWKGTFINDLNHEYGGKTLKVTGINYGGSKV